MNNDNPMTSVVTIFTDGSSRGNPGPGGWGAIIIDGHVTELGGAEKNTTNNRMELTAVIKGLCHSKENSDVTVLTDSSYVINGITKWIHGWKRTDWKTKTKEDVLNKDLWMDLDEARAGRKVTWKYVGGHIGIIGNERCDVIATGFAVGKEVKLYEGELSDYEFVNIMDIRVNENLSKTKKSSSNHSKAKAYSYVSLVGGKIETHKTWVECEKRVKGAKGARYKKALSIGDEAKIRQEFGSN